VERPSSGLQDFTVSSPNSYQESRHNIECLKKKNIETKIVNRFAYTEELINWADMVITFSGGDGTYLLAAR